MVACGMEELALSTVVTDEQISAGRTILHKRFKGVDSDRFPDDESIRLVP